MFANYIVWKERGSVISVTDDHLNLCQHFIGCTIALNQVIIGLLAH